MMPAGLETNKRGDTMNLRLKFLPALLLGLLASGAVAQTVPPVLIVNIDQISISDGTIIPNVLGFLRLKLVANRLGR